MPRLILLRHAKSDWDAGAGSDFDRPVAARGRRELPLVAAAVSSYLARGAVILCSPAVRTRQTYDLACPHWPEASVRYVEPLYECGNTELIAAVRQVEDEAEQLVVIGHNPGLVMFLNWCLAEKDVTPDCVHMPTSCAAVLELAQPLSRLAPKQARLAAFIRAKDLIAREPESLSC